MIGFLKKLLFIHTEYFLLIQNADDRLGPDRLCFGPYKTSNECALEGMRLAESYPDKVRCMGVSESIPPDYVYIT